MNGWMFVVLVLVHCIQSVRADEPTIVHTNYGDLLGYQTDLARVFRGVPFAQPPVNELRWNPPVDVHPWAPRVLNATTRPPACPQPPCVLSPALCPPTTSEDCLYMNIYTPLSTGSSSSALPVMLFLPGGAFQILDGSMKIYNAERYVNTTNVVAVFAQYRLGVLGFFATGTGPNDIKGNYGILDQRLAMSWVRENILVFGGDPNQVTLFGESAGGQSAALHYLTDDVQSYFKQVVVQSAPMTIPFKTYDEYFVPGALLAEQLHCGIRDVACFRRASAENITAAQTKVNTMLTSLNILDYFEPWVPVIDHDLVHGQLYETILNVSFPLKPLIIGTLTEETVLFIYFILKESMPPILYRTAMLGFFKTKAESVLKRYPPVGEGDQRALFSRILTEWVFACSTRIYARRAASYSYVFGYPYDFDGWKPLSFCDGHVCHGGELPYLFEALWSNFTDAGRRLSESMATYWTNFAKSQDPNEPMPVATPWPRMDRGNETYMFFQSPLQVKGSYLKDECDFWDSIGYKRELF